MPLAKISKQVLLMKKFIRIIGFVLLLVQFVLMYVLYSNPELSPIGGIWFFLVFVGFIGFQYFYHLIQREDRKESVIQKILIGIALLWLGAMVLLLNEPVEFIPVSQIAVMIAFITLNYRLFVTELKSLELSSKIYLSLSTVLFIYGLIRLISNTDPIHLSEFIRLKTTVHVILVLIFIAIDRVIIDLLQVEKDLLLKIANRKTLNLKSTLLNEVDEYIHKPLNLLRISLESVRLNTFGEPREIAENGMKQLTQIERYLGSILKVNKIESKSELSTKRVLKEFSIAYKN
jgi:hypothetical protein